MIKKQYLSILLTCMLTIFIFGCPTSNDCESTTKRIIHPDFVYEGDVKDPKHPTWSNFEVYRDIRNNKRILYHVGNGGAIAVYDIKEEK